MGQFFVNVETVIFFAEAEQLMPAHPGGFPFFEPFQFGAGTHEELHFHLLELAHAENELPGYDFVPERLTDLCYSERNFHASSFLNVQEIHEDALCRFGTQVDFTGTFGSGTHFGGKHQVELAYFRPVAGP